MFLPEPTPHGGSRVGNSYVSLYANCPRKWAYTFLYSMSPDTQGISPVHTAPALLGGSVFHEMMAAYLRSGCIDGEDTGNYDLDRAIQAGLVHHETRALEYLDAHEAESNLALATEMMTRYHEVHGPNGTNQDYPLLKVLCNERGEPLVEKEFVAQLGYKDYIYTARLDAIVEHHGFVRSLEHKTSAPSWIGRTLQGCHRKAQFTGQVFILKRAFEVPLNGVLVNVVSKRPNSKGTTPVASRDTTDRTPLQLERFRLRVLTVLINIDEAVSRYRELCAELTQDEALDLTFPEYGEHNDYCYAFNRECEFLPFCKGVQSPDETLRSFRPRTKVENTELKEYGG